MSRLLLTLALLLASSGALRAQAAPSSAPEECFGFSFGPWDPPLKSIAPSASSAPAAVPATTSRDWAARLPTGRGANGTTSDSLLVLFPAWWPNGIGIEWSVGGGDTLSGVAHAFVSDGRVKSPESRVRAVRVPCQGNRP
jgi:hypothetical protein